MEAVTALFSKAAAAGRWALGMLELGVTVPLDTPERLPRRVVDVLDEPDVSLDVEYNPATGLMMLIPGMDIAGNPEGCSSTHALGDDD
jgi:hypothetical protein